MIKVELNVRPFLDKLDIKEKVALAAEAGTEASYVLAKDLPDSASPEEVAELVTCVLAFCGELTASMVLANILANPEFSNNEKKAREKLKAIREANGCAVDDAYEWRLKDFFDRNKPKGHLTLVEDQP